MAGLSVRFALLAMAVTTGAVLPWSVLQGRTVAPVSLYVTAVI